MENLQGLIANIVNIFGKHIITEKTFVNMLADYRGFDGNPAARRILNAIVSRKYAAVIIELSTSEYDLMRLKMFANELSESDGFQTDLVETIMRMLVFVCNEHEKHTLEHRIEKRHNKFGCIDTNGNILIPFEYDKMMDFVSEYGTHIVCVKNFETARVYTDSGELVFSGEGTFQLTNDRCLWIVEQNGKYGAIHPNGEIVVPIIYKRVLAVNPQGKSNLLVVETETGMGIVDYKGKLVLPPMFENICNYVDDTFDVIEAKMSDRYMYFNSDGSVAELNALFCATPLTDEAYNANDHKKPMGFVVNGDKLVVSTTQSHVTDLSGKIICHLGKFNDGLAVAQDSIWLGYMNSSLEFVIREFRHTEKARFTICGPFNHGWAIVWKYDHCGLIDTTGEFVVNPEYDSIIEREWCVLVRSCEQYVTTCFDEYSQGNCLLLPYPEHSDFISMVNGIYDIGNFHNGRAFARYKNFVGIVTSNGKQIEPLEYEWFTYWYTPKLHEAKEIRSVRRNGVWGKLDIDKGFIPSEKEIQDKCEHNYLAKHREKGASIPYFLNYQKDETPCGFKWSNVFYIPVEKYTDFMSLKDSMSNYQRLEWLQTNGVITLK